MTCQHCGAEFDRHPKACNQKYCSHCRAIVWKAQQKAWCDLHKEARRRIQHRYYLNRRTELA